MAEPPVLGAVVLPGRAEADTSPVSTAVRGTPHDGQNRQITQSTAIKRGTRRLYTFHWTSLVLNDKCFKIQRRLFLIQVLIMLLLSIGSDIYENKK